MRKSTALWIGSLVFATAATVASAQPEMRGPGPRDPAMMFERLAERLDLSDEQRTELQPVLERHRGAVESQRQKIEAAHEALQAEIEAAEFDEPSIRAAAGLLAKLQADGFVARASLLQEVRKILTPDQFAQFQRVQERRHARSGPGRDRLGRSRGPRSGR